MRGGSLGPEMDSPVADPVAFPVCAPRGRLGQPLLRAAGKGCPGLGASGKSMTPLRAWERSYLLQPLLISLSITINGNHC